MKDPRMFATGYQYGAMKLPMIDQMYSDWAKKMAVQPSSAL
jgi:hypothetical protein